MTPSPDLGSTVLAAGLRTRAPYACLTPTAKSLQFKLPGPELPYEQAGPCESSHLTLLTSWDSPQ